MRNSRRGWVVVQLLLLLLGFGRGGAGQDLELGAPPAATGVSPTENTEILARGPVHEAFAEQVSPDRAGHRCFQGAARRD